MAIDIRHEFVSPKADSLDSTKVQPSNWNEAHDIEMSPASVIGRGAGSGQGNAVELPAGTTGRAVLAAEDAATALTAIGAAPAAQGVSAASIAATIHAASAKAAPVDDDSMALVDSEASNGLKKILWSSIVAALGTAFQAIDAQLSSLVRQNSKSANYVLVDSDSGKHIFHPSTDTTARVWTIPANASVPFSIGTAITFVNQNGAGVITIQITSDVMRFAGPGTTGDRILSPNGMATALKVGATEWIISGSGLA